MNSAPTQPALQQALERIAASLQSGNLDEAERVSRLILQGDPKQVDALNLLGVVMMRRGDAQGALEFLARACELDRRFTDAAYNRAVALGELERWEEALAIYDRVLRTDASNARAWNNRGNVLQKLYRWKEALAAYDRTLSLQPNHSNAHHNRGLVLLTLGRAREALAALERAVALAPDNAEANWTRSVAHLLLGEFEPGWRLHEWRWKTVQMSHLGRGFREPLWLGDQGIEGKTILLYADQGHGDTIQMARYVPLVEARGAKALLEVQPGLVRLMATLSPTVTVIARDSPLPSFDVQCPLGSLPLAFRTTLDTIPGKDAYLRPEESLVEEWSERLGKRTRPRIGIVWSGNPRHKRDRDRTIAFATLAPLLDSRFEWHAVQTVFREEDEAGARAAHVNMWRDELRDFAQTAALVANLDIVVSVDTSVAHLAGAMGKPAWILLTWEPDWRWLLGRDDSPWYASARLFRQPTLGDWEGAIANVASALAARP